MVHPAPAPGTAAARGPGGHTNTPDTFTVDSLAVTCV